VLELPVLLWLETQAGDCLRTLDDSSSLEMMAKAELAGSKNVRAASRIIELLAARLAWRREGPL